MARAQIVLAARLTQRLNRFFQRFTQQMPVMTIGDIAGLQNPLNNNPVGNCRDIHFRTNDNGINDRFTHILLHDRQLIFKRQVGGGHAQFSAKISDIDHGRGGAAQRLRKVFQQQ